MVGWVFMAITFTIAAYILWIWPHLGIFLIYWPLVLVSGLAVGIVGIVPVILLGKCVVWLWGNQEENSTSVKNATSLRSHWRNRG